jgi:hypothetical protein
MRYIVTQSRDKPHPGPSGREVNFEHQLSTNEHI